MTNPSPVEKQLLHMELSKGINEKDRAETADAATCLTQVQNLVQEQTGAYVKRPGNVTLATMPDSGVPKKLFRLKGGLGAVTDTGQFYQYQEGGIGSEMRVRGELAKFSLGASPVGSSGPYSSTASAAACTSCTAFHAIIANGWLELYDREAEAVVARYNIAQACGLVQTYVGSVEQAVAIFVGNRYLHVHQAHLVIAGDDVVYSFVIDTAVALPDPDTFAPTTVTTTLAVGGVLTFLDIDAGPDASYLLYADLDIPTLAFVLKLENDLTDTIGVMPDETRAISFSSYNDDDFLWYVTPDEIGYYETTGMTSVNNNAITFTDMEDPLGASYSVGLLADSSGITWVAYEYSYTVDTAKTITSIQLWKAPSALSLVPAKYATMDGWLMGSQPFEYIAGTATGYAMHVVKYASDVTTVPSTHVVVSIDNADMSTMGDTTEAPYTSFPVLASLEVNLGVLNYPRNKLLKMLPSDGSVGSSGTATLTRFSALVPVLATARGVGYMVVEARTDTQSDRACAVFGGSNYISGGTHMAYCGGKVPNEVGYLDVPILNVTASAAASTIPAGIYKFLAVYKHTDDYGNATYSKCSEIKSITVSAGDVFNVTVVPPNVTNKDDGVLVSPTTRTIGGTSTEIYRTLVGGTQYYFAGTHASGVGSLTGTDRIPFYTLGLIDTETYLAAQPTLHRQPGTPNSAVDRYPPPGGNVLVQHKDRLFTTDPLGVRVCYSSFFVDGETAWYNPAFSFFVHGGSGPITALASMDGRLFIFKRDSVFVVDGDGPGESGVTGNEYSPPQRLATEHGCIDHRTIAVSSEGIVYRSLRGIELLSRSLQVKFLGERVQNLTAAYPDSHGSTMDTSGRYSIMVSTSGAQFAIRELVYDFPADCWTMNLISAAGANDVCQANLKTHGESLCYAGSGGVVVRRSRTSEAVYIDGGSTYTPFIVETGWLKTGQQVRARYSKLMALLKANADCNHKMTLSVAYNYVDSYTQVATWEPSAINLMDLEQLEVQLKHHEVLAVRFKLEDSAPTNTTLYPIGTGRGPDVLGITLEVAPKTGAPKLASSQKA